MSMLLGTGLTAFAAQPYYGNGSVGPVVVDLGNNTSIPRVVMAAIKNCGHDVTVKMIYNNTKSQVTIPANGVIGDYPWYGPAYLESFGFTRTY